MHPLGKNKIPKKIAKTSLVRQKNDRACVVSFLENGVVEREKRSSFCRIHNMLVLTVLFSALVICVCVYAMASVVEENVLAEVKQYQEKLQMEKPRNAVGIYDKSMGGMSSLSKRDADQRRRRRRRRRRGRRGRGSDTQASFNQKSAVHMQITQADTCLYTDNIVNGTYFVWSQGDHRYMANFAYVRHPVVAAPHDILGIKIRVTGLYEVYSQVIINGLNPRRHPYYCAQEVVQIRANNRYKVLLKSFVTQTGEYNLNSVYEPAIDTVYQYGVFFLKRDDQVRVSTCPHVVPSNQDDKEGFYFGVVQK